MKGNMTYMEQKFCSCLTDHMLQHHFHDRQELASALELQPTEMDIPNPLFPQTGLASPGIEVVFPISPEAILIMYDNDYHGDIWPDLAFCATYSVNAVKHYNSAQIRSAVRTLISADDDFSFVAEEVQRCPQVLESPSVELHYGGRTYRPSGNSIHNSPLT